MGVVTLPDWYYKKWAMLRVWHPALERALVGVGTDILGAGEDKWYSLYVVEEGKCIDFYSLWVFVEGKSTKLAIALSWATTEGGLVISRDEGYGKAMIEIPFGLEYPEGYIISVWVKNYAEESVRIYINFTATLRKAE